MPQHLGSWLRSPEGQAAIAHVAASTVSLASNIHLRTEDDPSIFLDIVLKDSDDVTVLVSELIWPGIPTGFSPTEVEESALIERQWAIARLTHGQPAHSEVSNDTHSDHYVTTLAEELQIIVSVAGPPMAICKLYAEFTGAGVTIMTAHHK